MATKQQLSLKEYISFLNDETSIVFHRHLMIKHALVYQKYCYDLILDNKIDKNAYLELYNFAELLNQKKVKSESSYNFHYLGHIKPSIKKENWWKIFPDIYKEKICFYESIMYGDPSFKNLSIEYLKGYLGILYINTDKKTLDSIKYIELVKMINTAFEQWIIEWKDITIDFNFVVRNTFKILPRNFLKIA